eukprot:GHUV01012498.1.p1 GENE.GHUV01012498.1~~GHUV01012498.1.p1  ORF type:complete len:199 (+),score=18.12 GHUV01012498.1:141-737(+)
MKSLSTHHRCFSTAPSRIRPRRTVTIALCSSGLAFACPSTTSRRNVLLGISAGITAPVLLPLPASAGFKKELKKRKVPLEEYSVSDVDGLRYYDREEGRGKEIKPGTKVSVHFDCKFRGIDAVSSRYARTLGGNRTIAEPFEFVAGQPVNVVVKKAGDTAGGLFAGGSGPKPPPALSTAVIGMKPGGKVRWVLSCLLH